MTLGATGQPNEQPKEQPVVILVKSSTRFWAWAADFIIVTISFEIVFSIVYTPLAFMQGIDGATSPWLAAMRYPIQSIMCFAYWTYSESTTGQSIGHNWRKAQRMRTRKVQSNWNAAWQCSRSEA